LTTKQVGDVPKDQKDDDIGNDKHWHDDISTDKH
jgi:hypothetical protein